MEAAKKKNSILAEVRRYIETATSEQIARDIAASRFDEYSGIGDIITLESLTTVRNYLVEYSLTKTPPARAAKASSSNSTHQVFSFAAA